MSFLIQLFDKIEKLESKQQAFQVIGDFPGFHDLYCHEQISQINQGKKNKILLVYPTEKKAKERLKFFQKQLSLFNIDLKTHLLIASNYWDLSNERQNSHNRLKRIAALNFLSRPNTRGVVVASIQGLLQKTLNPKTYFEQSVHLCKNEKLEPEDLEIKMKKLGYKLSSYATERGSFATRGSILDFFSLNYNYPIRLEFFDGKITSIKYFHPETQKSLNAVDSVLILPCWGDHPKEDLKAEQQQKFYDLLQSKGLDRKHLHSLLEDLKLNSYLYDYEKVSPSLNPNIRSSLNSIKETQVVLMQPRSELRVQQKKSLEEFETLYSAIESLPYIVSKPKEHFSEFITLEKIFIERGGLEFSDIYKDNELESLNVSHHLQDSSRISAPLTQLRKERKSALNYLTEIFSKGYTIALLFETLDELEKTQEILNNRELPVLNKTIAPHEISKYILKSRSPLFILALGSFTEPLIDQNSQTALCSGTYLVPKPARKKINVSSVFCKPRFKG